MSKINKVEIAKGKVLHKTGDSISTVEIILQGSMAIKDAADFKVQAGQGTILGAFNKAGGQYSYDYVAETDCTLFSCAYTCEDDLVAAIQAVPSIAPAVASGSVVFLHSLIEALLSQYEESEGLYSGMQTEYLDYLNTCATLMLTPEKYDAIDNMEPPERPAFLSSWQADFCQACFEKDELLRSACYSADINFCIGCVMSAARLARLVQPQLENMLAYQRTTKAGAADFIKEYRTQRAKLDEAKRQEALAAGSGNLPSITNALDTILAFAGVDNETAAAFRRDLKSFMQAPDKTEKSDEMRRLRRDITETFYKIYEAAFFKSQETEDIPAEVKMFFLFGFVDEELAGSANTAELYKYALLWEEDPEGTVLPAYKWLGKIYRGEAPPSKNEFDNDWEEYLKEEVRTGVLNEKQAKAMADDPQAKVRFELSNMLTSANKMTYGSVFSFIPAFYADEAVRPLADCFATPAAVHKALNGVREIDYSCFYRSALASYPELKINRFEYSVEVLPYIILMPNCGSRGIMWQEIEGRRRTTPSHMAISIFHTGKLEDTLLTMCAQFRWEMCKRIQGVHYSDITDPSLTAEYCNYLQFYKKNHDLSADMKEKVKQALKRKGNSFREVFVSEYELYVKFEATGLPKLNKISRDILFRYCTFSSKYRQALSINPQFQPIIERWKILQEGKANSLNNLARKLRKIKDPLPIEIEQELEYMNM